jgi:hypothetical protein
LLAAIAIPLAIYYASIPIFGAHYAQVCSKGEYGGPNQCSDYDIVSAVFGRAFVFADEHSGLMAALAGAVVAVFTGVLWVATHKLWLASERQTALARDEFDAAHRPWIAIRGANAIGSVVINNLAIVFKLLIEVENTGSTPAIEVVLFGGSAPMTEEKDIPTLMRELISQYELNRTLPNEVIFPSEVTAHQAAFGQGIVRHRVDVEGEARYFWDTAVWGAFFYKSAFDGRLRYTTFAYGVHIKSPIMKIDEDGPWPVIRPEQVDIRKINIGWTAI